MMDGVKMEVGKFSVVTTHGRGHPPEFFADRLIDRLIFVSKDAPPPIREQAMTYKERMYAIILAGLKQAIQSDRTTVIGALRKAGMDEAAALVSNMEK